MSRLKLIVYLALMISAVYGKLPMCASLSINPDVDRIDIGVTSFVCKARKDGTAAYIYAFNDPSNVYPYGINCKCDDGHKCEQCALNEQQALSPAMVNKVSAGLFSIGLILTLNF